jgi:NTE family protein
MRRGLVLGCGGTVGGAWQVGALAAVRDALGWEPHTADVLVGTSAGAHLAALLGAGFCADDLVAAQRDEPGAPDAVRAFFTNPPRRVPRTPIGPPQSPRLAIAGLRRRNRLLAASALLPRGRSDPQFLDALADSIVGADGWLSHPAVWLVAADLATGERSAFGAPGAPHARLHDALRASWAIPGWYPPVEIDGRRYVDGGAASTCSADLLASLDLDEVVIIAPMASRHREVVPGLAGRIEAVMRTTMSRGLDAEVAELEARGSQVLRVHPSTAELAAMGPNFMDPRRRMAALEAALEHVPAQLAADATDSEGAQA